MRRRSGPAGTMSGAVARRLAAGLLGISFAVALPAGAQANNLFSIDPQAESTGPIVTDSSGTGYVAWNRKGPEVGQPIFCKIPRGGSCTDPIPLSLPAQSPQDDDGVIQPFPVLGGAAGVVYVVGPRYNRDDTLIWTSTNGGESFTVKEIPTGSFPDKTGVGDVLFNPNFDSAFPAATDETFAIAGENLGSATATPATSRPRRRRHPSRLPTPEPSPAAQPWALPPKPKSASATLRSPLSRPTGRIPRPTKFASIDTRLTLLRKPKREAGKAPSRSPTATSRVSRAVPMGCSCSRPTSPPARRLKNSPR